MEYYQTVWTIGELLEHLHAGNINLQPDYQRNPVWRSSAQTKLIESIMLGRPLPSFFVRELSPGKYEMVDGQQRARTIKAYWDNDIPGEDKAYFEQRIRAADNGEAVRKQFLDHSLAVTVLKNLGEREKIEDFYVLLNSTSLRLNRPELRKAEYYNTRFLALVRSAIDYEPFQELELFDPFSLKRMTDFEAASEALATIKYGIFDKKEKIDVLFDEDISEVEQAALFEDFCKVVDILAKFNQSAKLKRTRLKQKADLYTFFFFIHTKSNLTYATLLHLYQTFLRLAQHIRPSNDECEPLREYAHNCVTQSNAKRARLVRHEILNDLLANALRTPSKRQQQVLDYFAIKADTMVSLEGLLTFNFADLNNPKQREFTFSELLQDDFQE